MAKTLTLNTADLMGRTLQFPEFTEKFPEYTEKFPEYTDPVVHPFPEYIDPLDNMASLEPASRSLVNKLVEEVGRTPGRQPSPQPAHFSVPYKNGNGNGNRILRSATVGYIAPEFKGKKAQMLQGK
jgi:glutamate dehydrogenase